MPPVLDEIEEMGATSSNAPALDDTAAKPEGKDGADATSSAATDEAKDTLSIVRDVVDDRKEPEAPASSAEGEEAGSTTGDQSTKKEPDDENYSDVPFNKHPRFQHLLRKTKVYQADAQRYRNVQGFLDQNGLSSEEAADMLTIGALAKTNPAKAWEQVKPWVQKLLVAAGEVLPDELQQRVTSGELTREAALEVSRSRAQVQSFEAQRSFEEQRRQRQAESERVSSLQGAAQSWEEDRRKRDPNFDAKLQPIMKEIAFLHATEGRPDTPEGVRDQLQRAYKAVNDTIKSAVPIAPVQQRKPALRPVMGGQVAGNAQAAPKDTLGIIEAELSKRRAR